MSATEKKITQWGLFVEHEDGVTKEVILPDEIAQAIARHLDSKEVELLEETNGEIIW